MDEDWRRVKACEAYEVSNLGRIRRILPGKRTKPGNILKSMGNVRYRTATLVHNGNRHYVHIHVLVCETFHGPRPSPIHQVAHLNGNSHDNRAENLAWCTANENAEHKISHGTNVYGERVYGSKLTRQDVLKIRSLHKSGLGFTEIGRCFGVYYTTIRKIVQRQTWKHVAD